MLTITAKGKSRVRTRIYRLLRDHGHSATHSMEVIFDAQRGSEHAVTWIRIIFRGRNRR